MEGTGFVSGRDDRGHLIPERSAANQDSVNVPENVIPEHGTQSNRSVKKRWENEARSQADEDPGSWSVHEPSYDGANPRPSSVTHNMYDADGQEIPGMRPWPYD
jgi:DNA/RNA endonuclease G (NUC1)